MRGRPPSFFRLRPVCLLSALVFGLLAPAGARAQSGEDSLNIRRLYDEALLHGQSYDNLRYLTGRIGGRLAGSPQAQQAVEWSQATLGKLGLDRVYTQEVLVPHWVRGAPEKAAIRPAHGPRIALYLFSNLRYPTP